MPHSQLLAETSTENLTLGEQLLLWSVRSWTAAAREGRCPLCEILEPFELIKAEPVAEALHRTLLMLLKPKDGVLRVHPPRCGVIAEDESRFLLAAGAAFHESEAMAARLLSGRLKHDTAVALAAALRVLATVLSRHGLALPERLPPVLRLATPMENYSTPAGSMLLH